MINTNEKMGFCWLFPILVGPKVDSPTGVLRRLHFRLRPTDYGCLLRRRYQLTGSRFLFSVALLPIPVCGQTPFFL